MTPRRPAGSARPVTRRERTTVPADRSFAGAAVQTGLAP